MKFELKIPTKIYFGNGILEDALRKEKCIRGNVMIITTPGMKKRDLLKKITNCLEKMVDVYKIDIFTGITSNPKVEEINQGIRQALVNHSDVVIGVGGGTAMDAAKAVAAGAGAGETINRFFFEGIAPGESTLPIIAIPTTAGTGSELSKSSILTSSKDQIKTGVRGEYLYPKVAIVDPELTYTVPLNTTMETGFDVMAHAVESYLSKAANPFTSVLSEQAIVLVARSMRKLAQDLNCTEAREEMSYASMIMGINLGNASTVLPHRMQYPIGALTDTSHGRGLIALYPSWISYTYDHEPDKFNRVVGLITGETCNSCKEAIAGFTSWMDETCGRLTLEKLGLHMEDAEKMSKMVTGNIFLDPAGKEDGIILKIYRGAFKN